MPSTPDVTVAVPQPRTPDDEAPAAVRVGRTDLLAMRLAHRLARRDTRCLAAVADGLASGTSRFTEERALAFGEWVDRVCQENARHHDAEDEVLWPLLERHAGAAVDLSDLLGDHAALRALLDQARRRARAVVAALVLRPSPVATAADFAGMRELARTLAELADLVSEHLAETERVAFAALTTHVPRAAWPVVCDELRACTPEPRLRAVADPDEVAGLRAAHGALRELGTRVASARLRRRERLVYGPDDPAGVEVREV